ncbi:MAG: putative nicotinate-nucleotide adenylyltransferase [Parcubacteria group bacterium Gr01-1014_19]|nr:MAG: putative nicotinate-nucleotide adenylyltransferase [Parcubacteria group bacterium Gr01-1014_19]
MPAKKIVIYGGAFNPPHLGHAAVLDLLLKNFPCDEVWIVPSASRKDKQIGVAGKDRKNMLEELLKHSFSGIKTPIILSDLEINRDRPTVTYETKTELESLHPGNEFHFLIGSDSAAEIEEKWVRGPELFSEARFVIVGRPKFKIPEKLPHYSSVVGALPDSLDMSSTLVREKIAKGEYVGQYLPPAVEQYIKERNLYK